MTAKPIERKTERTEFTQAQLKSARQKGGISMLERNRRKAVETYTIDDVEPYVASDRDDGIRVEKTENGFRVHVTIADVAAHVPLDDPLAEVAHSRAFTVYRPWLIDHMFPTELMNQMSLEDGKERLGMQVSIDLDKNFRPTHTEFERVVVTSHAQSYRMAMQKMANGESQFSLMAKIAKGVREKYFGVRDEHYLDEAEGRYSLSEMSEGRLHLDHMRTAPDSPSTDFMKASRLVEVFMLLANSEVAKKFENTKMPFFFRNFLNTRAFEEDKPDRAFYDLSWKRHEALEEVGLGEAYCHFTSPIRRGPDFFCGHMAHYAIDVVEKARTLIPHEVTKAETLKHTLWDHLPRLLQILQTGSRDDLYAEADTVCQQAGISTLDDLRREALWQGLITLHPPLNARDMDQKLRTINALNDTEAKEIQSLLDDEMFDRGARLDLQEELEAFELNHGWNNCNDKQFTSKLRDAAYCGYMSQRLFEACERHLRQNVGPESRKKVSPHFLDIATTLIFSAPYYLEENWSDPYSKGTDESVGSWIALKRIVCDLLKSHPESPQCVNSILEKAKKRNLISVPEGEDALGIEEFSLPAQSVGEDEEETSLEFALAKYASPTLGEVSAPFYSVGSDQRAAQTHANYAFLEHMAFGQLGPTTNAYLPNPAYAELESAKDKQLVVKHMLKNATKSGDAPELSVKLSTLVDGRIAAEATVEGGFFAEPVRIQAKGNSAKEAENKALRRLLRHRSFSLAVSQPLPRAFYYAQHPNQYAKEFAAGMGLEVKFVDYTERPVLHTGPYTSEAQLLREEKIIASERSYTPRSNKDHSRRDAAQALIESQGWSIESPIPKVDGKSITVSWVGESMTSESIAK